MLGRGPVKCPSTPKQRAPMRTAGGGPQDQQIAGFASLDELAERLRSQLSRPFPGRFLRQNIGRGAPDRMVLKASRERTWNFWPPRHPAGGRGAETYVAPPSAGRRPAVRPPQVLPPAGPSHLTPSRPGEAKSRSDEAPRCPNQFRSPNQKTAAPPWPGRRPGRRPKSGPAQRQLGPIQRTDPGDMYWEMHLRPALRAGTRV